MSCSLKELIRRARNKIQGLLHIRSVDKDFYISKISQDAPWAYVSYISDVFYHRDDEEYLNNHQNKREALAQVEVFHESGYNVYVQNYLSKNEIPDIKFDVIFGHEPNFVRAARKNPDALKILYVPGAYIGHRNGQVIRMTDAFNAKYQCKIPYRRLLEYESPDYSAGPAYDVADKMLLIGSKYTIATFPEHFQQKIVTIHQSTQPGKVIDEPKFAPEKEFFFMGSAGNLLKGVSLLFEYFSKHPEFILNVVGPMESDVLEAMGELKTDNIILHGFVNVNSEDMRKIMRKCNFIIYPSGSEGMPGAVLNSMKNGLIPIVTPWAAFDEVEDYGYVLKQWDVESIGKGVEWAMSIPEAEIGQRKRNCAKYVEDTYSLDIYKREFRSFICAELKAIKGL